MGKSEDKQLFGLVQLGKIRTSKSKGGLGFRDIESFNMALLAKQEWRFLQLSRSMAARVFKEKYIKTVPLTEEKLGHRPSYIWRSV